MTTISDYDEREVEAARRLLESLEELFEPYLDAMSIVGGWVPEKRIPSPEEAHIGSTDVDVAIDRSRLTARNYQDIHDRLRRAGFSRTFSSFTYTKAIQIDEGEPIVVELDLLDGFGERWGDLQPMKAEAAPLAVTESSVATASTEVRVTSLAAFVVMKGLAMRGRNKPKDPYDIYFCPVGLAGPRDRPAPVGELRPGSRGPGCDQGSVPERLGSRPEEGRPVSRGRGRGCGVCAA